MDVVEFTQIQPSAMISRDASAMLAARDFSAPSRVAHTGGESSMQRPVCLAIFVILSAATLSPLLWIQVPPLVDYPNHLARMWILIHGTQTPELASNYSVDWRMVPNLAMDLVVFGLSRTMPVEAAGRVFVGLAMLAVVAGTVTLHRVLHGRPSIWPIWSVLFVYNAALFWGFVNFLFATGVYLFAFSGWTATQHWRLGPRILTFSAVASLLVPLHLFAFALYGLSVVCYELTGCRDLVPMSLKSIFSRVTICLQFFPGILLWYLSLGHSRSTFTAFGDPIFKFYALISPVTFGVEPTALEWATVAGIVLFLIVSIVGQGLKCVLRMRLLLAAMAAVAVLTPNWLSGSYLADIRLPIALPFVLIASTDFKAQKKGIAKSVAAAAFLLLGVRVWTVSQVWRDYDRWFDEFRTASAVIAPGARLLVVKSPVPDEEKRLPGVPTSLATLQSPVFNHMAALAVIDRAAFFPYLFTGLHSIKVAPRNEAVSQAQAGPITPDELTKSADPEQAKTLDTGPNFLGERPYWRDWPQTFDFVLWVDLTGGPKPELKQLQPLAKGSFFDIYRVARPPAGE